MRPTGPAAGRNFIPPTSRLFCNPVCSRKSDRLLATAALAAEHTLPGISVQDFLPEQPISRAERPARIGVVIENTGAAPINLSLSLQLPAGVKLLGTDTATKLSLLGHETKKFLWRIEAYQPLEGELRLHLRQGDQDAMAASLRMSFCRR